MSNIVCWLLILASIGYVAAEVFLIKPSPAAKSDDFQLELNAKSAVGQKLLAQRAGQAIPNFADAMRPVDRSAVTPTGKLRAAIVAGELGGAKQALQRLDAIRPRATTNPLSDDLQTVTRIYADQPEAITDENRAALTDRHKWFGELALAYGLPDDDPGRAKALDPAMRTMGMLIALGLGIVLIALAGFVMLVLAIVLLAIGKVRPLFTPIVIHNGAPVFLEAFAIYITTFVLFGQLLHRFMRQFSLIGYLGFTLIIPALFWWTRRRGASRDETWLGFGWHRGRGVLAEMGCGIGGYLAGLPLVALGIFVMVLLSKIAGGPPSHPITNEIRDAGPLGLLLIYLLASVWAPLMEETMFRGALFNHLRVRWNWIISSLVIGLLFALVHPQGWTAIPALGAIGVVLSCLREWRGSLIGPMTAHALNNATVLTIAINLLR